MQHPGGTSRNENNDDWHAHCARYSMLCMSFDCWLEICMCPYLDVFLFSFLNRRHMHSPYLPSHTCLEMLISHSLFYGIRTRHMRNHKSTRKAGLFLKRLSWQKWPDESGFSCAQILILVGRYTLDLMITLCHIFFIYIPRVS
jgi:hypothetical protein